MRNIEAACGNGVVDDLEACDDGNREPGDACTNDCQVATCGDKVLRTDLTPGEVGAESAMTATRSTRTPAPTCARWRPAATDSAAWI